MVACAEHAPVLAGEVLEALSVATDGRYIDATFGRGGHSRLILRALGPGGQLLGIDKDPDAIGHGGAGPLSGDRRLLLRHGSFGGLYRLAGELGWIGEVRGLLLDLGVSSPQLDRAERGFSFLRDGPLDMRMDNTTGVSAAAWIAAASREEIAQVLKEFGEERFSRRIAGEIVATRNRGPIATTSMLAAIIDRAVPVREKGKHPATRSFQAIRIHLNNELDELRQCLNQSLAVLAPGGRLVVISFHSLEDRIVKRFIRSQERGDYFPPDLPVTSDQMRPRLKPIGKPLRPSADEIKLNPRARSAVLRVAERL